MTNQNAERAAWITAIAIIVAALITAAANLATTHHPVRGGVDNPATYEPRGSETANWCE